MPVIYNKERKTAPYELYCDFCNDFVAYDTELGVRYSGHFYGKPKFCLKCPKCIEWQIDHYYIEGCLIQGVGRVTKEFLVEHDLIEPEKAPRVKKSSTINVDWNEIDNLINAGKCSVSAIAKKYNVNSIHIKSLLQEHYGDTLIFKKGRNGGVYRANTDSKKE